VSTSHNAEWKMCSSEPLSLWNITISDHSLW
jgi:hypothetical protein